MDHPWYAAGSMRVGDHRRVGVSIVVNCNTDEIAYEMDVLTVPGFMLTKVKVKSHLDFEGALENILSKASYEDADILREDVKQLATWF